MNNILNTFRSIKSKAIAAILGQPKMKQELLLRLALIEKGFSINNLEIRCDHTLGIYFVNDIKLMIKYPDSFYNQAINLVNSHKIYDFYFKGNMNESGKRDKMLKPFEIFPNTKIISTNEGRIQSKKDKFDIDYYSELAKAKFGLCPNQADWPGDKDYAWTYRFVESCFVKAIPVIFQDAPLGKKFIDGFNFIWDCDIIKSKSIPDYDINIAKKNQLRAKQIFCLSRIEIELIKNTL